MGRIILSNFTDWTEKHKATGIDICPDVPFCIFRLAGIFAWRIAPQLANTQASCSKYTVQAMPKGLLYLLCASVRKMKNNRDFTLAYCLS